MTTVQIVIRLTEGQQIRPAKLNAELKAAGFTFTGLHNAQEAIVTCAPADEAAIRALIAAHLAHDHAADDAAEQVVKDEADAAIKQDAVIASIKAMAQAEYDVWWAANVTNAAQAIGVLKRVVRIVCRRLL